MDANGAVVIGAKVNIENASTKIVRTLVTNSSGFFSVTELPTGTYNVSVEAKGFEKWQGSGIVLNASDDKTLNIPLKVGAESETITVTASSGTMDITESGAISHTIGAEQLHDLSLVGRNALEYLKILPGSAMQPNGGKNEANSNYGVVGINGSTIGGGAGGLASNSFNGQAGLSVSINQDGQNVMDPGSIGSATPVNANPDMISSLTIQTSNYTADTAKGPVVVNAISKSGGAQFHGDIRYSRRDRNMNAEDAFNKQEEAQNPTQWVRGQLKGLGTFTFPGFNVGGPVILPHDKWKNKLFFHEFAENYRQLLDGGLTRDFVPSQAELTGDFSGAAALTNSGKGTMPYGDYNWLSSNGMGEGDLSSTPIVPAAWGTATTSTATTPRPGCVITSAGVMNSACISPAAQLLLKDGIPTATSAALDINGFNYVQDITAHQNDLHNDVKLDMNFSDNTKAYVNWSHQSERAHSPMGLWTAAGDGSIPAPSGILGGNTSDVYTANLVQVFTPTLTVEGRFGYEHIYLPGSPQDPAKVLRKDMGFPLTGVWGNANAPVTGSWGGGVPMVGDIGHDYHPDFYAEKGIPSAGGDLTKVLKTHTAKAGVFWEHVYNAQDAWAQYMGFFDYGYWTSSPISGNIWADELMGINVHYTEQAYVSATKMEWTNASAYLQDHWRVNHHLVVDYGLRFEHYGVPFAGDDPYGSMTFNASKYGSQFAAGSVNPGLSYYGIDHSVPQSGGTAAALFYTPRVGASYDVFGNAKTVVRGGWGEYRYNWGFNQNAADTVKGTQYWTCNSSNGCPTWEAIDAHVNTGGSSGTSNTCAAADGNCAPVVVEGKVGNLQNQSVGTIDPTNTDMPYTTSYSVNFDQQLPGKIMFEASYAGSRTNLTQSQVNIDPVPIGTLTNPSNISTINGTQQLTLCSGMDGGVLANQQTDGNCQQLYRPYSNYQGLNAYESAGKSRYDSFQASLTRSTSRTMLMLNYTWAKNLGTSTPAGAYKDYGMQEYWSVLSLDRGHVLNASYVFRLKGDWEISGITQVESGPQLSSVNGYSFGLQNAGQAAQMVGTPDVTLAPIITCNPAKGLKKGQFVNPDCFADPIGINGIGNGKTPYLAGPMYWDSDLTVTKRFSITERQKVEFRIAGINFMNHDLTSFSNGDANLKLNFDSTTHLLDNGNGSSAHACPGPACTDFGYADYHRGWRILELSAKYSF